MREFDSKDLPAEEETVPVEKEPFVPSPVSKRIWAWMGIVYVIIVMILITYWIATTTFITGITGILLFPALGAFCAQGINNTRLAKNGQHPGNPGMLLITAILMGILAAITLVWGILQLMGVM